MLYEICYLVGESNESKLAEVKAGVEKIINDGKGVFSGIETIDRRKLAYKVQKDIRGIYVTRRFELPEKEEGEEGTLINEMSKKLNLYNDILRFLIIRADKLPELKQREIPVKTEKGDRRYNRSRLAASAPVRRDFVSRTEVKESADTKVLADNPKGKTEEQTKTDSQKEESIDQKLDELLNI